MAHGIEFCSVHSKVAERSGARAIENKPFVRKGGGGCARMLCLFLK
jgi:hypothetical protein